MACQSPSRHSFPSTQRDFLDKKPPEWFKGDSTGWINKSTGKPGPDRKPLWILASSEEENQKQKQEEDKKEEEEEEAANNVTALSPRNLSPRYTTPQTHPRHRHLHSHEKLLSPCSTPNSRGKKLLCLQNISQREILGHTFRIGCRAVLPQPMEVDGPMVQKVVVGIEVFGGGGAGEEGEEKEGGGDSVLEFLVKLQKEQELMKGYVYAPFRDVIDRLHDTTNTKNTNSNERNADAKTTLSISRRQIFN